MVDIMRETWGDSLVDRDVNVTDTTPLPPLDSLRRKILIKVKRAAAKSGASQHKRVSDAADSSDDEQLAEAVKKGKIIEELGSMGVYTRSCHLKSFSQPEAKLPTHVFALSEKKLTDMYSRDPHALFQHNKASPTALAPTFHF